MFLDVDGVMFIIEYMICDLFNKMLNVDFGDFLCMMYKEVMMCFGSDKLDLCNLLELIDVVDLFVNVDFKVFSGLVNDFKGCVVVICVFGGVLFLCK